jgi:hypothetical protein
MTSNRVRGGAVVALLATWLVALAAARPLGEFPLFDDWCYAWPALRLAQAGTLEIPEATSALPIAQILWGVAFVELAGASHLTLRISTIVAALVGALCWWRALRALGFDERTATWALAVALFSPAFFSLAPTFMTDVPFVAASQAVLLAGLWWARDPSWPRIAVAAGLALTAAWVRQPGAALLVGLAVAALSGGHRVHALAPAVGLAAVLAGQVWFARDLGAGLPLAQRMSDLLDVLSVSPGVYVQGLTSAAAFIGVCVAPAALAAGGLKLGRVLATLAALLVAWLCFGTPVLHEGAMWGACELGGARSLLSGLPHGCAWAAPARIAAVLAAAVGLAAVAPPAARAFVRGVRTIARKPDGGAAREQLARDAAEAAYGRRMLAFVVTSFAALTAGMTALWLFADRYWLLPAAVAPALVLRRGVRHPRLGAAALAAYALVAVVGTRDVFGFYTQLNALTDALVARGVPIERIDAGYAVNGWRRYLVRPSATAGEGKNADVPWVSAIAPSRWTIANRLEDGWRVDEDSTDTRLVVERLRRSPPQRARSGFCTAGWCE